ncbi:hypothetical protein GCM10027214_16790 [Stenotrophomonas tumulicola]
MGELPDTLGQPGKTGFLNRGNGMSIPVHALFAADASQVPAGCFFTTGDEWYLSVNANNGNEGGSSAILLTGEGAGGFVSNPYGTATYISGDYSVDLRADSVAGVVTGDGPWIPTLMLGSRLTIFCKQFGSDRLFTIDGQPSEGGGVAYDRRRFTKWQGWMVDKHGRTMGNEPLFTVEAR